ncbi:MAG TPA: bifunctional glutamate N-acetyltransferase/amino-acid acetyltransferase ArgJ [Candidatus Binataceae bacterium]|nr:bifunctional glutamate N-acetyltransferase/amino-acid acetyltransferase ArgJ [Candidatus Binataceae bacterium]
MKVVLAPAPVRGFRLAGVSAGLKTQAGAKDLGLIAAERPCPAAAVFSANQVRAAPVYATIDRIRAGRLQAIVANSGCANSFTGKPGLKLAEASCAAVAEALGCSPRLVAPSSTGVIGHLYDLAKFRAGVREAAHALSEDGLEDFARAIMTTDTRPKMASTSLRLGGAKVTIAGAVKGVGMISPHMATMLGYVLTDAAASSAELRDALKAALPGSFNAITVDGDMSTNDTVIVMASGAAENRPLRGRDLEAFNRAIAAICAALARELVADGEGATKLVTVEVRGARTSADAERCARQIANSPLVKTAFFGCDPNVGRILMAAGSSGAAVQPDRLVLSIGGIRVAARGALLIAALGAAQEKMRAREFDVTLDLRLGAARKTILTCDLSYDYVRINAEYTT